MSGGDHLLLIGLPGSGKTTVGRRISALLNLPFTDLDEVVEAQTGQNIPAIFAQLGESGFRALETDALCRTLKAPTRVIATGGGAVLREENRTAMRKNGLVIFLDRAPEEIIKTLDIAAHPTVQGTTLRALSEKRRALYLACADAVVTENDIARAAQQCAELWRKEL